MQKGWYDYQYLEDFDSHGNPIPSGVIGVVFPVGALDTLPAVTPGKKWVPMARVAMFGTSERYEKKYNFRSIPLAAAGSGGVTVEECSGTWTQCDPGGLPHVTQPVCKAPATTGFVRILARDGTAKYFCNIRRPFPPGFTIPGVTRWRWKIRDETLWIRCPSGCCEADPDA
jgi:hypothetical protein